MGPLMFCKQERWVVLLYFVTQESWVGPFAFRQLSSMSRPAWRPVPPMS